MKPTATHETRHFVTFEGHSVKEINWKTCFLNVSYFVQAFIGESNLWQRKVSEHASFLLHFDQTTGKSKNSEVKIWLAQERSTMTCIYQFWSQCDQHFVLKWTETYRWDGWEDPQMDSTNHSSHPKLLWPFIFTKVVSPCLINHLWNSMTVYLNLSLLLW